MAHDAVLAVFRVVTFGVVVSNDMILRIFADLGAVRAGLDVADDPVATVLQCLFGHVLSLKSKRRQCACEKRRIVSHMFFYFT